MGETRLESIAPVTADVESPPLRPYEEYRRLLESYIKSKNPEAVLPELKAEFHFESDAAANAHIIGKDESWTGSGKVYIGGASLTFNQEEKTALFKYITLYEHWRGKEEKYGYAAYFAIIKLLLERKTPLRLIAGHSLSRAAHAVWKGFVTAGIARMIGPEIVNEKATDSNYSTTKFELI